MATANPATLMAHGGGVLSAVMGSSGIVSQAAFVPVAGALMQVPAPLMAFQLLSTIGVMKQFGNVYKRLEHVEKSISRIIRRSEATFVGTILSAGKRLDDIEGELRVSRQFTPSMITRLAIIEGEVGPTLERYKFLFHKQEIQRNPSAKKVAAEDFLEDLRWVRPPNNVPDRSTQPQTGRSSARTVPSVRWSASSARRLSTILAPLFFQRIPEAHSRCLTKVLQAASVTPDPIGSPAATKPG